MKFEHFTLENCDSATGLVIVIDVLRAFTTAAYAFAAGVEEIILVGEVEEAFTLREEFPASRIMGEVNGLQVEGFDYGNSPPQFDGEDLSGICLIQRTTSGTQGVVRSRNADKVLTASFCNVGATINFITGQAPDSVSFVNTGVRPGGWGDEDQACADYIESKLTGQNHSPDKYLERVRNSTPGIFFLDPKYQEFPQEDLDCALKINKFDFVMEVTKTMDHLRMVSSAL